MFDLPPLEPPPWPAWATGVEERRADPTAAWLAAFTPELQRDGLVLRQWRRHPGVYLLEFADRAQQGAALHRIAALIEGGAQALPALPRAGDPAATAPATAGADRYIGHDYRLTDLAGFYRRVQQEAAALSTAEQALLDALLAAGALHRGPRDYPVAAPNGALISIARWAHPASARHPSYGQWRAVLRHELSHAEYFANPAYRAYCRAFWHGLDPAVRTLVREQLARWGYDPSDEELAINELQAYLWEAELGLFLDLRLRRVGRTLSGLRARFLAGIDRATTPITDFFALPGMRQVWPRGPDGYSARAIRKLGSEATDG